MSISVLVDDAPLVEGEPEAIAADGRVRAFYLGHLELRDAVRHVGWHTG